MQKFVILSGSRSGTSLLASTLACHPDMVCHGEVFHKKPSNHLRGTLAGLTLDEINVLRADDSAYLEKVFDQPDVAAVGFKMWQSQNPAMCDTLMADESVLKIIYERTNIFARYTSSNLVKATGVYNKRLGDDDVEHTKARIEFDRKAWNKYEIRHKRLFKTYRDAVKGPVLDFSYEDLLRDGFDPVLDFLGVARVALTEQRKQLYSPSILERFTDGTQAEAKALLDELGRPDWAHENKS